jgi:hypothetical protein
MISAIVLKLNRHLASGIQKEADVVYTLTEIRKVFEQAGTMLAYPVLDFYANWAVHATMDRHPWAKTGMKTLEDAVHGCQSDGVRCEEVLVGVSSVLSFQRLHRELLEFGGQYDIAFEKLSYDGWRRFARLLIDILIDCPLLAKSTTGTVRKLALSRDFTFVYAGGETLAFWRIDLSDGKFITGPIF